MSNAADYLDHNAFKIKLDGSVGALEKLHQQIAMLEMTTTLRRAENQPYQAELTELEQCWHNVINLANMVLETQDFGRSGYFDPDEIEPESLAILAEQDKATASPRKLNLDEQKDLMSRYAQWEETLGALKGHTFINEEALENKLTGMGLNAFFETRTPHNKPYRFCSVMWPHDENAGEWVEAVELEVQTIPDGVLVNEIFFPQ